MGTRNCISIALFHCNYHLFLSKSRLIQIVFPHFFCLFHPQKSPDCWRFIEALNWLNPNMTKSIANPSFFSDQSVPVQLPKIARIRNDNALAWIYENLRTNQLVAKLRCLLSDSEHLVNCYEVTTAFFHSKKFIDAMFECLIALEKQQPHLLAHIDRNLYTIAAIAVGNEASGWRITEEVVPNQRPPTSIQNCDNGRMNKTNVTSERNERTSSKRTVSNTNLNKFIAKRLKKHTNRIRCKCKHVISVKLRPWVSVPDIRSHSVRSAFHCTDLTRCKSQPIRVKNARIKLTAENLAINEKRTVPVASSSANSSSIQRNVSVSTGHTNNDTETLRPINLVKCDDIKIHLDRRHLTHERSNDLPTGFTSPANDCPFTTKSNNNLTTLFRILPNKKNIFPFLSNTNSSNTSNESGSASPGKPTGDFVSFRTCNGEKIENRYRRSVFDELLHDSPPQPSSTSSPMRKKQMVKSAPTTKAEPTRGQTLTSYLQEAQRSRFNVTDLERENAHFTLSDAIIAAIEEIKCGRHERQKEKQIRAAAIAKRKNRVRPRRLKNWVATCENEDHIPPNSDELNISDCEANMSDSNLSIVSSISSASTSSASSSSSSNSSHVSSNSDTSTASKPGDLKYLKIFSVSSHSINDHAAYAEWAENSIESLSAEGIALSLISKFKDRQLPQAADLLTNTYDHVSISIAQSSSIFQLVLMDFPLVHCSKPWIESMTLHRKISTRRPTHVAHPTGHRLVPKLFSPVICHPIERKSFKCKIIDVPAVACVWRPLSNTVYATASTWANTIALVAIEIKYQQYRHVYWIGTNAAGRQQFSNSTSNSHCFIFFRLN